MKQDSRLEDWFITAALSSDLAQPDAGTTLHGRVYGDNRFPDGYAIRTSPVVEVNAEQGYVITKSGTRYKLGNISPEYKQWLEDNKGGE